VSEYIVNTHGLGQCWKYMKALLLWRACHVLLFGAPGTGKTTWAATVAPREGQEVFSTTLTRDSAALDIWGCFMFNVGGGTSEQVWYPGVGMQAWQAGGHLVLNEVNYMEDTSCLLNLLDDPEVAMTTLSDGTAVTPHENKEFRCIATMNGLPEELEEALRDRFRVKVNVDFPSPEALAGVGLPPVWQETLVGTYSEFKEGGDLLFTFRELAGYYTFLSQLGPDGFLAQQGRVGAHLLWGYRGEAKVEEMVDRFLQIGMLKADESEPLSAGGTVNEELFTIEVPKVKVAAKPVGPPAPSATASLPIGTKALKFATKEDEKTEEEAPF
jgi:hypothetical protein